ncbi:MAG TPA: DUF5681 domain-containing protein [Rhizomicrobium sp.]|nr:DUF5681 domain-containing protein [Rhizomicrobium sp.]
MDDSDAYQVGYKRPPRHSQFQPGQSGNPKGRPRKQLLGIPDLIQKHLDMVMTITEGRQTRRVTAREAIVRRLLHDAAAGEPRAMELLLLLQQRVRMRQFSPNDYYGPVVFSFDAGQESKSALDSQ